MFHNLTLYHNTIYCQQKKQTKAKITMFLFVHWLNLAFSVQTIPFTLDRSVVLKACLDNPRAVS